MFEKLIKFFITNSRFNYTLFALIVLAGITTYILLPKEKFPDMELDRISISGGYSGASNDLLDKIAVREIEDEIKSIEGIDEIDSKISNNSFDITLTLLEGQDKFSIAQKVRDAISKAKQNFPSDMNEPTVKIVERSQPIITITVGSDTLNFGEVIERSEKIKEKLLLIPDVASIEISGDSDNYINILIDSKKIEAYSLTKEAVANALKELSYIYPLGKIEDKSYHLYLTTYNGKKEVSEIENTILRVDGKNFYLKDIAKVEKRHKDSDRIATMNGKRIISLVVKKSEEANALVVSKRVKEFVKNYDDKELTIDYYLDESKPIRNRLNNVISNIFLGLILVTLSMHLLINKRIAFIVMIGIPTSFFIAFIYFYFVGLSINLVSLLGILIALGIVVDDAIIVSENIQRHIEEGMEIKRACVVGANEVITPVTMASLTTIFTFLPLLFISGRMGQLIEMIPIAVTALVVASYIESFFFLPIHASHTLSKNDKPRDWSRANRIYRWVLEFFIKYKKSFLIIFVVIVPLLTFLAFKNSKFQMMPRVDLVNLYVSGKLDINTKVEDTSEIAKEIELEIRKHQSELSIANLSTIAGFRRNARNKNESGSNLFYLFIELNELVPQNFVDKYITPTLSFDYEESEMVRELKNREIIKRLKKILAKIEKKYNIEEFSIYQKRIGVKVDVEIGVITDTTKEMFYAINKIESKLKEINGVIDISNNAFLGVDEVKLKINSYGEMLGVSESYLAKVLSNLFLANKKALLLDDKELLEVVIEDNSKDNLATLKNLYITLPNGKNVKLSEVVEFITKKELNSIDKRDFKQMKAIYANADTKLITPDEILEKLEPTIEELQKEGIEFKFYGEKERKERLMGDLGYAVVVAIFLIFLSLLYMFNSFKHTLIIISVIPFSLLGVLGGHFLMDMNLTMPGLIGAFGLAGVVINDGIIMLDFLRKATTKEEILNKARKRFRPIILTSLTTLIGLSTLIFFVSGQGKILQPIAVSLGFGLAWGTVLNLIYVPVLFSFVTKLTNNKKVIE